MRDVDISISEIHQITVFLIASLFLKLCIFTVDQFLECDVLYGAFESLSPHFRHLVLSPITFPTEILASVLGRCSDFSGLGVQFFEHFEQRVEHRRSSASVYRLFRATQKSRDDQCAWKTFPWPPDPIRLMSLRKLYNREQNESIDNV